MKLLISTFEKIKFCEARMCETLTLWSITLLGHNILYVVQAVWMSIMIDQDRTHNVLKIFQIYEKTTPCFTPYIPNM